MVPSLKTLERLRHSAEKCTRGDASEILQCLRFALERRSSARKILEECDVLLDGFGVEYITHSGRNYADTMDGSDLVCAYVNLGDTYTCTIVWNYVSKRFEVTSWGDFWEWYEAKFAPPVR